MHSCIARLLLIVAVAAGGAVAGESAPPPPIVQSGVGSGLCVVVGAKPASELAALTNGGRMLVECLVPDRPAADALRAAVVRSGLIGLVTVKHHPGGQPLPYVSTTVNLLIGPASLDAVEVARVVAPYGATILGGTVARVPMPAGMDEWPMVGRGPDQNPCSTDRTISLPTGLRWIAPSLRPFEGGVVHSEYTGFRKVPFLAAGGRVITFIAEAGHRHLACINPFNGTRAWTRASSASSENFAYFIAVDTERVFTYLDLDGPLHCLDAATGATLWSTRVGASRAAQAPMRWPDQTWMKTYNERAGSMTMAQTMVMGDLVVATRDSELTVLDAQTGAKRWTTTYPAVQRMFLAAKDGLLIVVQQAADGGPSGHRGTEVALSVDTILGLDLATGKERWRRSGVMDRGTGFITQPPILHRDTVIMPIKRASDPVAGNTGSQNSTLPPGWFYLCLRTSDGGTRWQQTDSGPGAQARLAGWASHAFVNPRGELWIGWALGLVALDAATGKPIPDEFRPNAEHTPICQWPRGIGNLVATGRYWFDTAEKSIGTFSTARAPCNDSVYPAYGSVMLVSQWCLCAKWIQGSVSLVGGPLAPPVPDEHRLESFSPLRRAPASAGGWTSLMANAQRGGRMDADLAAQPAMAWRTSLEQPLPAGPIALDWPMDTTLRATSPAVMADDLVLVARGQQHQLVALDRASGAERWRCQLGGRIDGPPTLWHGHAYVGCRDGWVYAIDLANGSIRWRHLVASDRRHLVHAGQLESLWPVGSSVIIQDGALYACGGISAHFDGGLWVTRLDPLTGKAAWRKRVLAGAGVSVSIRNEPLAWVDGRICMDKVSFDPATGDMIDELDRTGGWSVILKNKGVPVQPVLMTDPRARLATITKSNDYVNWPGIGDPKSKDFVKNRPIRGFSGTHQVMNQPWCVTAHRAAACHHWAFDEHGFYIAGDGIAFWRKGAPKAAGGLIAYAADDPTAGSIKGRAWENKAGGTIAMALGPTQVVRIAPGGNTAPAVLVRHHRSDGQPAGTDIRLPAEVAWRGIAAAGSQVILTFTDGSVGCWR